MFVKLGFNVCLAPCDQPVVAKLIRPVIPSERSGFLRDEGYAFESFLLRKITALAAPKGLVMQGFPTAEDNEANDSGSYETCTNYCQFPPKIKTGLVSPAVVVTKTNCVGVTE